MGQTKAQRNAAEQQFLFAEERRKLGETMQRNLDKIIEKLAWSSTATKDALRMALTVAAGTDSSLEVLRAVDDLRTVLERDAQTLVNARAETTALRASYDRLEARFSAYKEGVRDAGGASSEDPDGPMRGRRPMYMCVGPGMFPWRSPWGG